MRVIYTSSKEVEMWSINTFTVTIITYITEHQFLGFYFYHIHQNNPKLKNCTYDGEYSSNMKLESIRNSEKQAARLWLAKYKQQNIINYEKDSSKNNCEQKL